MTPRDKPEPEAGIRLSAPTVPSNPLQSIIASAISESLPQVSPTVAGAVAAEVAGALCAPEVLEELVNGLTRALRRASDAHFQRDDIYEYPGSLETAARVAVEGLTELLGVPTPPRQELDRSTAEAILADVAYEDWTFSYVELPYPRVTAATAFPDTDDPTKEFPVTQYAVVEGDILEAAFGAVMAVLEHEAREVFRYRGDPVFHIHRDQGEQAGPILKDGAEPDRRRSYVADIGPTAGYRRQRNGES
jgi:hypothetical protein